MSGVTKILIRGFTPEFLLQSQHLLHNLAMTKCFRHLVNWTYFCLLAKQYFCNSSVLLACSDISCSSWLVSHVVIFKHQFLIHWYELWKNLMDKQTKDVGQYFVDYKTSLLRRPQAQTLPDATPPIVKIHPFSKMAVAFEPLIQFWCPSGLRKFLITMK